MVQWAALLLKQSFKGIRMVWQNGIVRIEVGVSAHNLSIFLLYIYIFYSLFVNELHQIYFYDLSG